MKLWGVLKIRQKIVASHVAEVPDAPMPDEAWLHEAIGEICSVLDIGRPVVLKKHADDFCKFSRVVFRKEDFMEKTHFDLFEIERIDEKRSSTGSNGASDD